MVPVLLLLVGIIEFAMAYRDDVAVTSAARTGARIASTGADDGSCDPASALPDETPCPSGQVPNLAQNAANAIARAGTALPEESIRYIMVYEANEDGYPGSMSALPASCDGVPNCVTYTWRSGPQQFRYAGGTWRSAGINACFPTNVDSVGVNVVADYDFITGVFGSGLTLSEHAVMEFEPLLPAICAADTHP
jgi:Flp pilus assembly protein TadG